MQMKFLFVILLAWPLSVAAAPLSHVATLRDQLPQEALGYLRIPSPWGLFTAPKGNALHKALDDARTTQQVAALAEAVHTNLLQGIPGMPGLALQLLLHHLRSPLEVLLLLPDNPQVPLPNALIQARVDFASIDQVNQFLSDVAANNPFVRLLSPLTAEAFGSLIVHEAPALIHFDAANSSLLLFGGPMASAAIFTAVLDGLTTNPDHPMHTLERKIDQSGQGFFVWVNIQRLAASGQAMLPPPMVADLTKWGLMDVRALALGFGVSDGKSRLKLMIDAPKAGYRGELPTITNDLSLTAVGEPGTVVMLSLPLLGLLNAFEAIAGKELPPQEMENLTQGKTMLQDMTGMSTEQVLSAFGPEVVLFTDQLGIFMAIRIGDKAAMTQLLDVLVKNFNLQYEVRDVAGQAIHHLAIPSMAAMPPMTDDPSMEVFLKLATQIKTHLYWIEDADYLIFGQVPQLLVDRSRSLQRTPLGPWLLRQQGQDASAALLLVSTTIDNTPRYLYYFYLSALQLLADMASAQLDLFALPSALELNLPAQGTYGLQLDFSDPLIGLELVFENNPLEFLVTMDFKTILATAMGAAMSVPAFLKE